MGILPRRRLSIPRTRLCRGRHSCSETIIRAASSSKLAVSCTTDSSLARLNRTRVRLQPLRSSNRRHCTIIRVRGRAATALRRLRRGSTRRGNQPMQMASLRQASKPIKCHSDSISRHSKPNLKISQIRPKARFKIPMHVALCSTASAKYPAPASNSHSCIIDRASQKIRGSSSELQTTT
jgi:hypothetical protein